MSLLTVGTVAFDKLESPFGKTDKILGGAATYIGMASSLLGVDTAIVSVVGGDFPQEYIDLLIQFTQKLIHKKTSRNSRG